MLSILNLPNMLTGAEIVANYPDAERVKLIDTMGVFGELPVNENNLSGVMDGYTYNDETRTLTLYCS